VEAVLNAPSLGGMGTTLTLALLRAGGSLELAHTGASRAYRLRGGELTQLTRDHTLVADLIAEGRLDPAEVRIHPQRNLLTRVIGMAKQVEVDESSTSTQPGDRLLLCSDGLSGMIEDADIARMLGSGDDAVLTVWALIEAANEAGGEDNITVIVVDITE